MKLVRSTVSCSILVWVVALGVGSAVVAVAEEPSDEMAERLLRAAEGQIAYGAHERAAGLAADALALVEDDILQWRALVVLLEASPPGGTMGRRERVEELQGWLDRSDLGDPVLRRRTLVVMAEMSEGVEAERYFEAAIRLVAADPVAQAGEIKRLLHSLERNRTTSAGCMVMTGAAPPGILVELADLPLEPEDRDEWWKHVDRVLRGGRVDFDDAELSDRAQLIRLVGEWISESPAEIPDLSVAAFTLADHETAEAMLEMVRDHPDATSSQRARAMEDLARHTKPRLSLIASRVVPEGPPIVIELHHNGIDVVDIDILPLAEVREEGAPHRAGTARWKTRGFEPAGEAAVRRTTPPIGEERSAVVEFESLPIGLWRAAATAEDIEVGVDFLVTDVGWMAWSSEKGFELVVVDLVTGNPVPGVPVRVGDLVAMESIWLGESVTNEVGRATFQGIDLCPDRYPQPAPVVAVKRDGRWLPWKSICPSKIIGSVPTSRSCEGDPVWIQLAVEDEFLVRDEVFRWHGVLSAVQEEECRPAVLDWTVSGRSSAQPVASGSLRVGSDGLFSARMRPSDEWPDDEYSVNLVVDPKKGNTHGSSPVLTGAWWRLGRLVKTSNGVAPEPLEIRFLQASEVASQEEPLQLRVTRPSTLTGSDYVELRVAQTPRQNRDGVRVPVMVESLIWNRHRHQHPVFHDGYGSRRQRDLLSRKLAIAPGESATVDLDWPENDGTVIHARASISDGPVGSEVEAAVVIHREDRPRPFSILGRRHLGDQATEELVYATARDLDRAPRRAAPIEFVVSPPYPLRDSVPSTKVAVETDGTGLDLVRVPVVEGGRLGLQSPESAHVEYRNFAGARKSPEPGAWPVLAIEPDMVEPGGEAEVVILSQGEGRIAVVAAGIAAPVVVVLDQPEVRLPVKAPENADAFSVQLAFFDDNKAHTRDVRASIQSELADPAFARRLDLRNADSEAVITVDPPIHRATTIALNGPVLWPPLPSEVDANGRSVTAGPPGSWFVSGQTWQTRLQRPGAARPRRTAAPGATPPPPPPRRAVVPAIVKPLKPALLVCLEKDVDLSSGSAAVCDGGDVTISAVAVAADEKPAIYRFIRP